MPPPAGGRIQGGASTICAECQPSHCICVSIAQTQKVLIALQDQSPTEQAQHTSQAQSGTDGQMVPPCLLLEACGNPNGGGHKRTAKQSQADFRSLLAVCCCCCTLLTTPFVFLTLWTASQHNTTSTDSDLCASHSYALELPDWHLPSSCTPTNSPSYFPYSWSCSD